MILTATSRRSNESWYISPLRHRSAERGILLEGMCGSRQQHGVHDKRKLTPVTENREDADE